MTRLISNVESIEEKVGFNLKEVMLTPIQSYDGGTRMPLLLEANGAKTYLLAREMERGNLGWRNVCQIPVLFHHPYFVLSTAKDKPLVYKDITDALRNTVGKETIIVDEELPYIIYHRLEKYFKLQVNFKRKLIKEKLVVYAIKKEEVISRFSEDQDRVEVNKIAIDLTNHLEKRDILKECINNREDNRFVLLDKLLKRESIEGFLINSFINFQEITGFNGGVTREEDILALYLKDEKNIYIITTDKFKLDSLGKVMGKFNGINSALNQLIDNEVIGFEEDSLSVGSFLEVQEGKYQLKKMSNLLRRWRECRVGKDFPYFIIAAQASKYAVEGAIWFAKRSVAENASITEKIVERKYIQLLEKFVKENEISLRIEPYFKNIHAGRRSIYPSRPIEYPLDKKINSFKIDAGVFVIDRQGLIRACSDIARTLVLTDKGEEIYRFMEKAMLELIQTVKGEDSGEDIYWRGIQKLTEGEQRIKNLNMMPKDFSLVKGYKRDIGHLLERQESFTFGFCKGNKNKLEREMIGCVEFHWPFRGHGMAVEDMFIVTEEGGIPISR